jgi:hypothetical protein
VAWRGVAWRGVAWFGMVWCGVVWCGVAWRGVAWRVRVCPCTPVPVCVYVWVRACSLLGFPLCRLPTRFLCMHVRVCIACLGPCSCAPSCAPPVQPSESPASRMAGGGGGVGVHGGSSAGAAGTPGRDAGPSAPHERDAGSLLASSGVFWSVVWLAFLLGVLVFASMRRFMMGKPVDRAWLTGSMPSGSAGRKGAGLTPPRPPPSQPQDAGSAGGKGKGAAAGGAGPVRRGSKASPGSGGRAGGLDVGGDGPGLDGAGKGASGAKGTKGAKDASAGVGAKARPLAAEAVVAGSEGGSGASPAVEPVPGKPPAAAGGASGKGKGRSGSEKDGVCRPHNASAPTPTSSLTPTHVCNVPRKCTRTHSRAGPWAFGCDHCVSTAVAAVAPAVRVDDCYCVLRTFLPSLCTHNARAVLVPRVSPVCLPPPPRVQALATTHRPPSNLKRPRRRVQGSPCTLSPSPRWQLAPCRFPHRPSRCCSPAPSPPRRSAAVRRRRGGQAPPASARWALCTPCLLPPVLALGAPSPPRLLAVVAVVVAVAVAVAVAVVVEAVAVAVPAAEVGRRLGVVQVR